MLYHQIRFKSHNQNAIGYILLQVNIRKCQEKGDTSLKSHNAHILKRESNNITLEKPKYRL